MLTIFVFSWRILQEFILQRKEFVQILELIEEEGVYIQLIKLFHKVRYLTKFKMFLIVYHGIQCLDCNVTKQNVPFKKLMEKCFKHPCYGVENLVDIEQFFDRI